MSEPQSATYGRRDSIPLASLALDKDNPRFGGVTSKSAKARFAFGSARWP